MRVVILRLSDTTDASLATMRAALTERYPEAELVETSATDIRKNGPRQAVRTLRALQGDTLVIASEDLRERRRLFIFKLIGLLPRVRDRFLLDPLGGELHFSRLGFLARDLPLILIDILASYLMALGWLIVLPPLYLFMRPRRTAPSRDRHLTVAFFRTDYYFGAPTGGSFSHIRGFVDGLLASGHHLFFIASVMPTKLDEAETPLHLIRYPKFFDFLPEAAEMAYNLKLIGHALPILKRERPDFLYHRHSGFHCATALLSLLTGIPLMLEVNNSEYWLRTRWDSIGFRLWLWLFEQVAWRGAQQIFVVSDVLKDDLIRMGVPARKIVVNPNGVDPDKFTPAVDGQAIRTQLGYTKDDVVVGFLGTFGVWHGLPVLAAAIPQIVEQNHHVKFLLIGEGAYKPEFEASIRATHMTKAVTLPGLVPHDAVAAWLAACDMLVSPHVPNQDGTRFFGSPTKLFEYMAMGKAIVASDLEQIGQILANRETALLTTPGSAAELVMAVLELADNQAVRAKLGEAARAAVIRHYTWQKNADRVTQAYRDRAKESRA